MILFFGIVVLISVNPDGSNFICADHFTDLKYDDIQLNTLKVQMWNELKIACQRWNFWTNFETMVCCFSFFFFFFWIVGMRVLLVAFYLSLNSTRAIFSCHDAVPHQPAWVPQYRNIIQLYLKIKNELHFKCKIIDWSQNLNLIAFSIIFILIWCGFRESFRKYSYRIMEVTLNLHTAVQ